MTAKKHPSAKRNTPGKAKGVNMGSNRTLEKASSINVYIRDDLWGLVSQYGLITKRTKRSIVESALYWYFVEKDNGLKMKGLLNPDAIDFKPTGGIYENVDFDFEATENTD